MCNEVGTAVYVGAGAVGTRSKLIVAWATDRQVLAELARGGMGIVSEARDRETDRAHTVGMGDAGRIRLALAKLGTVEAA